MSRKTLEKPLKLSDWNLTCIKRITCDLFLSFTEKLGGLLDDNNKIVNKIICDLGKVTKSPPDLKWSFCSRLLRRKKIAKGNSIDASLCF